MATKLQIGDLAVEVTLKDIKNVHLSVHPPLGRVTIAVLLPPKDRAGQVVRMARMNCLGDLYPRAR